MLCWLIFTFYLTDSPLLFVQTHVFCANKSHTTKWQVYFSFQFFYVVAWRFHNYEALKIFGTKPKTHEDRFLHGNLLAVISEQHTHGRILSKRNNLFRTRFKDPCIENVFEWNQPLEDKFTESLHENTLFVVSFAARRAASKTEFKHRLHEKLTARRAESLF